MNLTLVRTSFTPVRTLGRITDDADGAVVVPATLELPWRSNIPNISCIPAGIYSCTLQWSPVHHQNLYWVTGVAGRADVELHIGNTAHDTQGCILLGSSVDGDAIDHSAEAFDTFMTYLNGAPSFVLTITTP